MNVFDVFPSASAPGIRLPDMVGPKIKSWLDLVSAVR